MFWLGSSFRLVSHRKSWRSILARTAVPCILLLTIGCGGGSAPSSEPATHSVPGLKLTETGADNFDRVEGLVGSNWDVTVAISGVDGITHVNSITLLHNAAVANPRQTAYGLSQTAEVTSDFDHPKAFWRQSVAADQYVQLTYLGGIAYSEEFAPFNPTNPPQSYAMTGDAYGDFTWENTVTFNSFKAASATSAQWITNDFTIHGPNNEGYFGLILRGDVIQRANFYALRVFPASAPLFVIYRGSIQLTSGSLSSIHEGDVFTFAVVDSTLYAYQNSTLLSSITDNTLASGSAGIELNPIDVVTYQFQAPIIDNFVVGTAELK